MAKRGMRLIPATVKPPATASDDPRVGHLLGQSVAAPLDAWAVLLGFPCDQGVVRNGGRPGAAAGPDAIRLQLYRLTPDPRAPKPFTKLLRRTLDLGDLALTGDLEADQQALGETIAPFLQANIFVILLGGGHETSYGHFLGYVQAKLDVSILNWDAHADVRPTRGGKGHSGSPFRQALEHPSGRCRGYAVAGLQPPTVAPAHLTYLLNNGCGFAWAEEVTLEGVEAMQATADGTGQERTFVTFDLDAVDSSAAPGVSAPCVGGLAVPLWLAAAERAGSHPQVRSLDVVELNPDFDLDARTARLAARTVWRALAGLAQRLE